jgi:SOUL heme-binding protein
MWWIAVPGVLVLCAALWGPIVSRVEQPRYEVVASEGDIEVRRYGPTIVAEAITAGTRDKAIGEGFRVIADYIFGNNLSSRKVAMTAPVTQQPNEKIAMTAPVTQQSDGQTWRVHFIMPAEYTLETLPTPRNPAVKLVPVAGKRYAVIRFSGLTGDDDLARHTARLREYLRTQGLEPQSAPIYAFYNPPWTLPFMRRNEIMIEVMP